MDKLWYSRDDTGDISIKLFDPDEPNVVVSIVKVHKLVLTHTRYTVSKEYCMFRLIFLAQFL